MGSGGRPSSVQCYCLSYSTCNQRAESDKNSKYLFSEQTMKHRKEIQIFCHFRHDYKKQQHMWLGARQSQEQNVSASGEMDLIAIVTAIDAEQAR